MEPLLSEAFSLLGVGMITVFLVLLLVVITGNVLIRIVNSWTPEPKPIVVSNEIPGRELSAITAAVEAFTLGQGSITKIEKKN